MAIRKDLLEGDSPEEYLSRKRRNDAATRKIVKRLEEALVVAGVDDPRHEYINDLVLDYKAGRDLEVDVKIPPPDDPRLGMGSTPGGALSIPGGNKTLLIAAGVLALLLLVVAVR